MKRITPCGIAIALWAAGGAVLMAQPASMPDSAPAARPLSQATSGEPQSRPAGLDELDESLRLITGNNEPDARRLGARQLLKAGSEPAIQRLDRVLREASDVAAQIAVCEAVAGARRPLPSLVDPLVALLGDPRQGVSEAATRALSAFDNGDVIQKLSSAAAEPSAGLARRLAAIHALGIHGDNIRAIAALATLARNETNSIQAAATTAMCECTGEGFRTAAEAVAWWESNKALSATEWLRRTNAQLRSRSARLARGRDDLTRRIIALTRADYTRTPEADRPKALLALLRDDLAAVRELGLDLVNLLITDRKDIGSDVRERLAELIHDPDAAVRIRAARIVADLRMTNIVPQLLDVVRGEPHAAARAAQVEAVGRMDDRTAITALIGFLKDDSADVVAKAALALGNLARRGFGASADIERVASELAGAYQRSDPRETDIREQLLNAMSLVQSETVRAIFRDEIQRDANRTVRRAAIRALAAFRDPAAASDIRPLTESPDASLRLTAVESLGACGESEADLAALARCLDIKREPDSTVRDRSWDSFRAIMQRAGVDAILRASDQFAIVGDSAAQQRRSDLLKLAEPRLDELPIDKRIEALERMGQARMALGDCRIAATRFEQALKLIPDRRSPRYVPLSLGAFGARLSAGDDDEAVARLETLCAAETGAAGRAEAADLAIGEMKRRLSLSDPAPALRLAERAERMAAACGGLGDTFATTFAQLREDGLALQARARSAEIERLLDGLGSDGAAEKKLTEIGAAVLPPLHARLVGLPRSAASSQAVDFESRLISLARRLAPGWSGYEPAGPHDARASALEDLARRCRTTDSPRPGARASSVAGQQRSAGT